MRIIVVALTSRGKQALQKHLDSKLNPQQKLMKKTFFTETIIKEPEFKVIIGFKKPAEALIQNVNDFTEKIISTLLENGATLKDFKVLIDEEKK